MQRVLHERVPGAQVAVVTDGVDHMVAVGRALPGRSMRERTLLPGFCATLPIRAHGDERICRHRGGEGAAGLLTSLFGLGAVAAAVSYATWGGNRAVARMLPVAFGGIALALALTAVSPALWLVGLSLLLAGACLQMSSASLNVTLQLAAAEQTRARTMSAYMAALALGLPVDSAIHGALIETLGAGAGLALAAALSGVVALGPLASRSYSAFLLATWSPTGE